MNQHTTLPKPLPSRAVLNHGRESGVALLVALILLLVMVLIGLASVGSTIMQNKMAANLYDRSISFQTTEAGLRAAELWVANNMNASFIRDCGETSLEDCYANPFTDPNLLAGTVQTLATAQFSAANLATGQPQYVVEKLGRRSGCGPGSVSQTSINPGPNSAPTQESEYFRITARSGDPSQIGNRSMVVLQSMSRVCL